MTFELLLSVVLLAACIWVIRVQVPKARRDGDRFAFACSVATALVALAAWLFIGVATR
jgi:hypothetical protein